MRKVTAIILIITALLQIQICLAEEFEVIYEEIYNPQPLAQNLGNGYYVSNINGEDYIFNSENAGTWRSRKYVQTEYEFFIVQQEYADYFWTGQVYMARSCRYDDVIIKEYTPRYDGEGIPLRFYDKDFNLIGEKGFGQYIAGIGYDEGVYYCDLENIPGDKTSGRAAVRAKFVMSTDMENWVDIPNDDASRQKAIMSMKDRMDAEKWWDYPYLAGDKRYGISPYFGWHNEIYSLGKWTLKGGSSYYYVSNDGIYFLKIKSGPATPFECAYEYEDDIIIEGIFGRVRTPKQPIYDALERFKNAPYVILNDKILGFEEPPTIEDGRILVPMRFLFEKMGDKVSWDDATQTATVTEDNNNVAFSVDNAVAKVNGASKSMDVPARLVNDKTMVPLRFLSENLGYDVKWDESTNCAIITTDN